MRVKTLVKQDFESACNDLKIKVQNQYTPNLIIGILSGGAYVAKEMYHKYLKEHPDILYSEIKIQRENTKTKGNSIVKSILHLLPYFMLDILRILESKYLEKKSHKHNPKRNGKIEFNELTINRLKKENTKVLLVDDAIDTGATLCLIRDYIKHRFPHVEIKIAVITVTMKKPLIKPDFCLYNNGTLIRFPWSNDLKSNEKKLNY